MVRETRQPGGLVSLLARRHGIDPNKVFDWRKSYQEGASPRSAAASQ